MKKKIFGITIISIIGFILFFHIEIILLYERLTNKTGYQIIQYEVDSRDKYCGYLDVSYQKIIYKGVSNKETCVKINGKIYQTCGRGPAVCEVNNLFLSSFIKKSKVPYTQTELPPSIIVPEKYQKK